MPDSLTLTAAVADAAVYPAESLFPAEDLFPGGSPVIAAASADSRTLTAASASSLTLSAA